MSDPDESEMLHAEREERHSLRNTEDRGGHRRIAGEVVDDWPSWDEL